MSVLTVTLDSDIARSGFNQFAALKDVIYQHFVLPLECCKRKGTMRTEPPCHT